MVLKRCKTAASQIGVTLEKQLTERERDILLKTVELYLKEGEPVGSRTLQRTYALPFSPATIRNIMSDLEDKGYLYQPHTSAGRVPTDEGLKIYINNLFLALGRKDETLVNRLIDFLKGYKATERNEILTKVLDFIQSYTGYIGFGTNLTENLTVENINLFKVTSDRILIVVNFQPDYVLHKIIRMKIPEKDLLKLSRLLTQRFRKKTLKQVKKELIEEIEVLRQEISDLSFRLSSHILQSLNEINHLEVQGTSNIVNMVSGDAERLKRVLELLEEKTLFLEVLKRFLSENRSVSVILGSEIEPEPLSSISFVLGKFNAGLKESGVVGIVGPKRMNYSQVIPLIENVTKALSLILNKK